MLGATTSLPLSLHRTCRDVLAIAGWQTASTVIGLISALPGEGVTTLTLCMATVLGQTDRVLVIDGSFGRRSAAEMARLDRRILTAADLAARAPDELDDRIVSSDRASFDLLSLEPSEQVAAQVGFVWPGLRVALGSRYRVILVDLGSLRTQRSAAWSTLLDHSFMIVDSSRTTTEDLAHARQELDILKLTVSGVILNRRAFPGFAWFGGAS